MKILSDSDKKMLRIWKIVLSGLLISVVLLRIMIIVIAPPRTLVGMVSDDGFYYLNVAVNIANGFGSTFDQLNTTNGYHPLWMSLLVLIAKVINVDSHTGKELLFIISLVVQFLLWLGGMTVIFQYFVRRDKQRGYWAALIGLLPFTYPRFVSVMVGGLESSLVFFLLVLLLITLRSSTYNNTNLLMISVLLGLVFLARLDNVFLIISVLIFLCAQIILRHVDSRMSRIKALIALSFPVSTMCILYGLGAFNNYGHLVPISGELKSSFPQISVSMKTVFSYLEWLIIPLVVMFVYLFWGFKRRSSEKVYLRNHSLDVMLVFGIGIFIHALYSIFFMNWAVFAWHFVSYLAVLSFMAGDFVLLLPEKYWNLLIRFFERARPQISYGLMALLSAAIFLAQLFALVTPDEWHQASYDAALFVRENFPDESIFAMKDAGTFGFFSGRRVVNLDGVINGYQYQIAISENHLSNYLCDQRVGYVAQHSLKSVLVDEEDVALRYEDFLLKLPGRLYGGEGFLLFTPNDEVYRQPYPDASRLENESGNDLFVIWKLSPCLASEPLL